MDVRQALFRKIAAALPGMEALSSAKQDDLVDINLKTTSNAAQTEGKAGGCSCWYPSDSTAIEHQGIIIVSPGCVRIV